MWLNRDKRDAQTLGSSCISCISRAVSINMMINSQTGQFSRKAGQYLTLLYMPHASYKEERN